MTNQRHGKHFGRRALLRGALATGGLAALATSPLAKLAAATPSARPTRLVFCMFQGGWDVLISTDPRDPAGTYSGIDMRPDLFSPSNPFPEPFVARVGETGDVLLGGTVRALQPHLDVATLVKGVNMNTVAHLAGTNYINTFDEPAGASPSGSSLPVHFAAASLGWETPPLLPAVSVGFGAYNTQFEQRASALALETPRDLHQLVSPPTKLPAAMERLLGRAREEAEWCGDERYSGEPLDDVFREMRAKLRMVEESELAARFAFDAETDEMRRLQALYGFTPSDAQDRRNGRDPRFMAATAGQLLRSEISAGVAVRLTGRLDDHQDWNLNHAGKLEPAFEALAALLTHLREDDPNLERTAVIAGSEFGRTPRVNGKNGRDHWFVSSVLVFGGGLRPRAFGESDPETLGLLRVDPTTGRASSGGVIVKPEHVASSLLAANGLPYDAFRADPLPGLLPA